MTGPIEAYSQAVEADMADVEIALGKLLALDTEADMVLALTVHNLRGVCGSATACILAAYVLAETGIGVYVDPEAHPEDDDRVSYGGAINGISNGYAWRLPLHPKLAALAVHFDNYAYPELTR